MSELSEITSLFATLASNLQTKDPMVRDRDDQDLSVTISNLNRSLNLSETQPRVRILDTALSLMCFTAPQVFESLIAHSVETIVAVLSSSIQCKVLRVGKEEVLRVGGSISSEDCGQLINVCVEILDKLEGHGGDLSPSILHAVVRVAVMASGFPFTLGSAINLDAASIDARKSSFSKLLCHIPKEVMAKNGEIPPRNIFINVGACLSDILENMLIYYLSYRCTFDKQKMSLSLITNGALLPQLWYLDSEILKCDISQILQEVHRRPFLCLAVEFYERMEWRAIIVCLALAPAMFVEAKALLHNWFLVTGLASVLELQIQLVSVVLDVLSRPMWWGLSMETGSKMPFSLAYFPYSHQLIRILAGPLSWEGFQHLVHKITRFSSQRNYHTSSEKGTVKMHLVDHRSMWAIAMNFPDWFFFGSLVLFSGPSSSVSFHLSCTIGSAKTDGTSVEEMPYCAVAARFIAWILNPVTDSHQDLLVDYLTKISGSWVLKKLSSDKSSKVSSPYKEVRQLGLDCLKTRTLFKYDGPTIWVWLREFQDMCLRYCRQIEISAQGEAHRSQGYHSQQIRLFRRMTLGILIGFFDDIDEVGCELLLHYAATGNLFQLPESEHVGLKHKKQNCGWQEVPTKWTERYTVEEAVAGARVVFDLTDVIENMSSSLFETEERGLNFMSHVKLKIGMYLIKCAKRFLLLRTDEDYGLVMLTDLCNSIVRWRHQGQDVFRGYKDLDDITDALRCLSASF